jgi:hypothetical protein
MLAFLEAKEWPLVSKVPISDGKQKGGLLSGRSYAAVQHSVDKVDEKTVRSKPVSMTPLDLLRSVLAYGGEEVRTAVNCYELDISGSSVVLASVAAKKTIEIETKGSSVIYWLKVFLELSRLVMDWVRGCLGRLVGLDSKFNGFKPKNISKKPIIHLKPVCKSLGQGFKVFSRSSLQLKVSVGGPSVA